MRRALLALLFVSGAACHAAGPRIAPGVPSGPAAQTPTGVVVHELALHPRVAVVVRSGDPRASVAVAVATDGGAQGAVALAAVIENRLLRASGAPFDVRVDADGYRVRVLVDNERDAAAFIARARAAFAEPVSPGTAELDAAAQKLSAFARRLVDAPALVPVARCTGALGVRADTTMTDVNTAEGAARIEAWRQGSHVTERVAWGFTGPEPLARQVLHAAGEGPAWPSGARPADTLPITLPLALPLTLPTGDVFGAYTTPNLAPGAADLFLSWRLDDPWVALSLAASASDPRGSLRERLGALATPLYVGHVAATAKPSGGCLSMVLSAARSTPASDLDDAAASAAAMIDRELKDELGASRAARPDLVRSWRPVITQTDPRDAASLAAWWALSQPIPSAPPIHLAAALAVPSTPEATTGEIATRGAHVADLFAKASSAWQTPVIESRARIERGQGEMWLLMASPCGTSVEGTSDAGFAALGAYAAATAAGESKIGVQIEPWVSPDGVGLLAHAPALGEEKPLALAERIATELARAFIAAPPEPTLARARPTLLGALLDARPGGAAFFAALAALAPSHPSSLWALGTSDAVLHAGTEAVAARWATLSAGPVRLAVLANDDAAQADRAVHVADRHLVRRPLEARATCPPPETPRAPTPGARDVAHAPSADDSVILALPVSGDANEAHVLAELLVLGLNGKDGWLAKAVTGNGLAESASAWLIGGARSAAIVIEVRAAGAPLDPAALQIRALLQRLREGAITQSDWTRLAELRAAAELARALDPRQRVVDLFRGPEHATAAPPLEAMRAWAAGSLGDDKLTVVSSRAKR